MTYKFSRKHLMNDFNSFLVDLASPANISYMWNFGSLLGLVFIIQIITGLFLSFYYAANVMIAFDSVVYILRDMNSGWLIRYLHINGASFFFLFIYFHIGRGIYYFSFKKTLVWVSGVIILLMLMMIAFMGYILPWGQMSFWGATVITNLLSSVPVWGQSLVYWVWGSFSVDNSTLNRFFSFHFIFPFIMLLLVVIHLVMLHFYGSSNPLGLSSFYDKIYFYPYFAVKDFLGFFVFFFIYFGIVLFMPLMLADAENFIPANPLVTPAHIQPEWYYLFAYAILRSIPNKLGGVVALFSSILILFILGAVQAKFSSMEMYPILRSLYFLFIINLILLVWVGTSQVEWPFYMAGQVTTGGFFFFFFFFFF